MPRAGGVGLRQNHLRFGFIGSRPLHLVSFSSFPLHTHLFSSFLSCLPVFMFVISSLSFFCAHTACLSMHVHNLLQPRLQVAQVFTVRWVFIGCPCALGSLSSQPHTPLSRLVLPFHVFTLLSCCAHTYTFALALALLASPRGGVCVCVCTPSSHTNPSGSFFCWSSRLAGGWSASDVSSQRRHIYCTVIYFWDTRTTYLLSFCGVHKLRASARGRQERTTSSRPDRHLVELEFWPLTKGAQAPSLDISGFWFLRLPCGERHSSQYACQ